MMPVPHGPSAGRPFVGRERELATLHAALERALGGAGQVVLVAGEPGIGKTRLADELSATARAAGVAVLWGRSWEGGGAPAFWPWVQILRAWVRDDPTRLDAVPPALRDWLHAAPATPPPDGVHARFALFDATAACLSDAARVRPLLLVLDDLHAADRPSLLLLQFLARTLRDVPLLLVGTYREAQACHDDTARVLADVAREGEALGLAGLGLDDIRRFVAARTGTQPAASIVTALGEATGGNPFFLDEMVRLLGASGDGDRLPHAPERVRDAIRRRLEPLPAPARDALAVASVVGREIDRRVLEAVTGRSAAEVEEALDLAVAGGIVAVGSRGTHRFVHALIRETLYDGLGLVRRTATHAAVGAVLARLHADDLAPHRAALAHHFLEAAEAGGDVDPAVAHAQAAGTLAMQALAFEEAATLFGRAIRLVRHRPEGARARCELGIELARAHRHAGDLGAARRALGEAVELARGLDPTLLARAALEAGGAAVMLGRVDAALVTLLEEALAALGEADGALRSRLLARLAMELCYAGAALHARRSALSQQAIEMAERLEDWQALGYALTCRHVACMGPENVVERQQLASAIIQVGRRTGDRETAAEGYGWRVFAELELGNLHAADADVAALARLGNEMRQPHYQWLAAMFGAMRAIVAGRDDAETLAGDALSLGQRAQDPNAFPAYASQLFILRWQQGRLNELAGWMPGFADENDDVLAWRAALVHLQAVTGDVVPARRAFASLCDEAAAQRHDITWMTTVTLLADACVLLGAAERAEQLHAMLLPFAERNLVTGPGSACLGAAARHLGRLETLLERDADAEAHFVAARRMHEAMGARPWLAFTLRDHATMLLRRDRPRALALLDEARVLAAALGLGDGFADLSAAAREPAIVGEAMPTRDRGVCRREGDYWLLEFRGVGSRLRDAKGLRILAHLLRNPGREFHAAALVAAADGRHDDAAARGLDVFDDEQLARLGMHAGGLGDAGELLDPQARGDYRRRLAEIDGQLAAGGGADGLAAERAFLVRELGGGTGLGGRGRRAAAASERARVSVTRALRAALERIASGHEALGDHLATTVRTGTFCAYEPDPHVPIVWSS